MPFEFNEEITPSSRLRNRHFKGFWDWEQLLLMALFLESSINVCFFDGWTPKAFQASFFFCFPPLTEVPWIFSYRLVNFNSKVSKPFGAQCVSFILLLPRNLIMVVGSSVSSFGLGQFLLDFPRTLFNDHFLGSFAPY